VKSTYHFVIERVFIAIDFGSFQQRNKQFFAGLV
jgi:hypothetical protein